MYLIQPRLISSPRPIEAMPSKGKHGRAFGERANGAYQLALDVGRGTVSQP